MGLCTNFEKRYEHNKQERKVKYRMPDSARKDWRNLTSIERIEVQNWLMIKWLLEHGYNPKFFGY